MNFYYLSLQQMADDLATINKLTYQEARKLLIKYKPNNELLDVYSTVKGRKVRLGEQRLFKTPEELLG